jgi:hypothetical protein
VRLPTTFGILFDSLYTLPKDANLLLNDCDIIVDSRDILSQALIARS